ncbi:uncharacterized protein B0H18DRAFT_1013246 [Fomitopsis serialis]|uniref:uncharacterized protein n=1 Tax=Fomitopsis serialis TaxID=139415 RepID=UPI00200899F3|nr:uncharacterized protein B0H18DRAFT_1013246 [Neoantrodia serialis]KAH9924052.1 hypothetical protein B0H18DRAFT_1013246 [Neoantrodia serialis]
MAASRRATSRNSQRYQPYKDANDGGIRATRSSSADHGASRLVGVGSAPSLTASSAVASVEKEETLREGLIEMVRKLYPGIIPRHDYDLCLLAEGDYKGPLSSEQVYAWLDEFIRADATPYAGQPCPSLKEATALVNVGSAEFLEKPSSLVTGRKPRPGERNVFVRPIPNCAYSIRLFPGVSDHHEFCLDFVHTKTGKATNSPFECELWSMPDPITPWLSKPPMKLMSLENCFGVRTPDIRPGEEKFLLKEGVMYLLVRPGKRAVHFTVPIPSKAPAELDADPLDLPRTFD